MDFVMDKDLCHICEAKTFNLTDDVNLKYFPAVSL